MKLKFVECLGWSTYGTYVLFKIEGGDEYHCLGYTIWMNSTEMEIADWITESTFDMWWSDSGIQGDKKAFKGALRRMGVI